MNKACFLDRDGVINEEVNYLHEPEKVVLISGIAEGIKLLKSHGYKCIVVTNQAGVAKGYFPESDIALVHDRVQELLQAEGTALDGFYYCPHHGDFTGECGCRKPAPGMILQGVKDFDVDVNQSFLIGDRMSDINAGHNAKLQKVYLTMTGYGKEVVASGVPDDIEVVENPLVAIKRFLGVK